MPRRRVIPNAQIVRLLELDSAASSSNSSASFGLELGKPASMKPTPSASSALDDAHLLGRRQRHALALHAVAERGVVELDLGHVMPFASSASDRARPDGRGRGDRAAAAARRLAAALIRSIASKVGIVRR